MSDEEKRLDAATGKAITERREAVGLTQRRLLADSMLDNVALKDLLEKVVTPAAHREAAAHLQSAYAMSERRACRVLGVDRTSVRY